jgi:hypothetical protein
MSLVLIDRIHTRRFLDLTLKALVLTSKLEFSKIELVIPPIQIFMKGIDDSDLVRKAKSCSPRDLSVQIHCG